MLMHVLFEEYQKINPEVEPVKHFYEELIRKIKDFDKYADQSVYRTTKEIRIFFSSGDIPEFKCKEDL